MSLGISENTSLEGAERSMFVTSSSKVLKKAKQHVGAINVVKVSVAARGDLVSKIRQAGLTGRWKYLIEASADCGPD